MFHRVKSEVQKAQPSVSVRDASDVVVEEKPETADIKDRQESLITTPKASLASPEIQPKKKETMMSEDSKSQDDRPLQDQESSLSTTTKPLEIPVSGYQQQPAARPASPYGNPSYPGYAAAAANTASMQTQQTATRDKPELERRLVIGQGISMSGQIESCDFLLVEGTIEAALKGARLLEISETGNFYGTVEIDEAMIAGRFEGDLTVNGRLTVKSGGIITGSITYKELAIEAGAIIDGKISPLRAAGDTSEKKPLRAKAAGSTPSRASKIDAPQPANTDGQLFSSMASVAE